MGMMDAPIPILDNLRDMLEGDELTHSTVQTSEVYQWAATMPLSPEARMSQILEGLQDGIHKRNNSKGDSAGW